MKVDREVIEILEECRIDGDKLHLPDIQLKRPLYVKVNKVLELIGGKWNRKEKAHLFTKDIGDVLDTVILSGEITDIKKELQYFPTPKHIVKQLIDLADVRPGDKILEPSAGEGAIAKELIKIGCVVDTCEIHEPFRDTLITMGCRVYIGDFLEFSTEKKYDKIIANPPFTRQQDIDHVNHMIDMCRGRVVSIMSRGVIFRENKKTMAFRDRLISLGGSIIDLPYGSFKESGTLVNTCIVKIDVDGG